MKITKPIILSLIIMSTFSLSGCGDSVEKLKKLQKKHTQLLDAHAQIKEAHKNLQKENELLKSKQSADIKKMLD